MHRPLEYIFCIEHEILWLRIPVVLVLLVSV